jgi:hypothetical protein
LSRLLDGAVPIALTVTRKGPRLLAQFNARAGVRRVTVTDEKRDGLLEELERCVRTGPDVGDG